MQADLHREGYGIFVRCCDLSPKTPVGEFVSTIEALDCILLGHIGRKESFFPSPYGGAIYCRQIGEALDAARAVASGLGASGISFAIGMAWGRFERTVNVQDWNAAARPLNHAARLAFCDAAIGHVLVTPHVRQTANSRVDFSDERDCTVKGAHYSYHAIESPDYEQHPARSHDSSTPEIRETNIILWDIVKYSTKDADEQAELSQSLALIATTALHKFNARQDDYSPTGDGGFALFDTGLKAIAFARELGTYATSRGITIRTGINHGEVAFAERGPVGPGVLSADAISAQAPPNGIAVLADVWRNLDRISQEDWRPTEIAPDLIILERTITTARFSSGLRGIELDYQNVPSGVLVRNLNSLSTPGTFRLILMSLHNPPGKQDHSTYGEISMALSNQEVIGAKGKGQWHSLAFVTKKDSREFKIESKDESVPSIFVREPGTWRLRLEVLTEEFGRDVFDLSLRWNLGDSPEASEVRSSLHQGRG